MSALPAFASVRGDALEIRVKAVPGASRDAVAGALGDRLKVRVAQPPEGGRANAAIAALLARCMGLAEREVELASGPANAQKAFVVRSGGADAARLCGLLVAAMARNE